MLTVDDVVGIVEGRALDEVDFDAIMQEGGRR